jgi:hypothetical protein
VSTCAQCRATTGVGPTWGGGGGGGVVPRGGGASGLASVPAFLHVCLLLLACLL